MSQLPVKVLRRLTSRLAAIVLVAAMGLLSATSAVSADKDGVQRVDRALARRSSQTSRDDVLNRDKPREIFHNTGCGRRRGEYPDPCGEPGRALCHQWY